MRTVYFHGHSDPGFVGIGLRVLGGAGDGYGLPRAHPLSTLPERPEAPYSVIVPLQRNLDDPGFTAEIVEGLRRTAVDVNGGLARVAFDYCNEAGDQRLVETLVRLLADAGVDNLDAVALIAQNRRLPIDGIPLRFFAFDVYPIVVWSVCRSLLEREDPVDRTRIPEHNVLCLNATPRLHRFATVLALLEAGLIRLPPAPAPRTCAIPYVSFPNFDYSKQERRPPTDSAQLSTWLRRMVAEPQIRLVDDLLAALPLRVDDTAEEGNELVTLIDLAPYRNSKISVVTETGLDPAVLRITEKTLKAVALGHPFITIGCPNSLDVVRSFGYSAFDSLISQSHDQPAHQRDRLLGAVRSAAEFVERYDADPLFRDRVREESERNIEWTLHGFATAYRRTFSDPMLRFLAGTDDWA